MKNKKCDLCTGPDCDLKKSKCSGPHKKVDDAPCLLCEGNCYKPCPYGGPYVGIEEQSCN